MKPHQADPVRPEHFISSEGLRAGGSAGGEVGQEAVEEIECGVCAEEEDAVEEVRAPQIARKPDTPTKAQIEAHFPLHAEYRSWCEFCVAGKGISRHHKRGDPEEEATGVTVSVDYCFWTPEESDEGMEAILVGYDSLKSGLWTMAVDAKGPTPAAVGWLTSKIEDSGYNGVDITRKSDQEESIKALKKAVSIKRASSTAMIESPVRVSKSNGQIERAVRTFQSQFRTLRLQLEHRLKIKVPKGSALTGWLINFTSDVLNRHKVHPNGKTNFEMVTGHRFKQETCGFAEKIHFNINTDKNRRNKMETDWGIGYYLGSTNRTMEHLIATEHGIVKCETIRRMPDNVAYDPACLEMIKIGYREYICDGATSYVPMTRPSDPIPRNPDDSAPAVIPRRTRISPQDLKKFGYTVGCQGCEAVELGHSQRRNHSENCRDRIEKAMQ